MQLLLRKLAEQKEDATMHLSKNTRLKDAIPIMLVYVLEQSSLVMLHKVILECWLRVKISLKVTILRITVALLCALTLPRRRRLLLLLD